MSVSRKVVVPASKRIFRFYALSGNHKLTFDRGDQIPGFRWV